MWRHAAETINLPTYFILLVSTSSSVGTRLRDPLWLRSGVFLVAGSSIFAWEGPASSSSGGSVPASTFDGPSFSLCPESGSVLDGSWSAGSSGSVPASDLVGKFSSGSSVSWNIYIFNYSIFACYNTTHRFSTIQSNKFIWRITGAQAGFAYSY